MHPAPDEIYDYGLFLLNKLLGDYGCQLSEWPSMPQPTGDWQRLTENPLIAKQLDYDRTQLLLELDTRLGKLNEEQRTAYECITASVNNCDGQLFFLNGPGGTGKTFVYNTVCAKLRGDGKIILCVSSSGISALLLRGGRTAHSMFKIPINNLHEHSVCAIPKDSNRAELMCTTSAIIWDEIGAQHCLAVEAVDRMLRDLRSSDRPFGGLTVILGNDPLLICLFAVLILFLGGDFLQTLPVVPKGSREEIVDATVQRSRLWNAVKILRLHQNMRLDSSDPGARQFAEWLLDVGHGRNMVDDTNIRIPASMQVADTNELIQSIYPGIDSSPPPPPSYFLNRMILAPRNLDVNGLNQEILGRMSGESREYISADHQIYEEGVDPADLNPLTVEFLRDVDASNLPPGELYLKVGCPVILLRNLAPTQGLCNGSRMIVTQMRDRVLEVRLIGGDYDGEIALIPRICMAPPSSAGLAFDFRRLQLPVRLAFALSVNKAQGQSSDYVGVYLSLPVFSHGQLYVALSHTTNGRNVKVLLPHDAIDTITPNVVYDEVLI